MHMERDGLAAHRCNSIQTLIESGNTPSKHSQHVNEKQLWFYAVGEAGGGDFTLASSSVTLPPYEWRTRWLKAGSSKKVKKPLRVNSTRTQWKRRQRGHFVVSVVPDILSGGTCCLRMLVCHSGHASRRRGKRGWVILNPINNRYIYLWGWLWLGMYRCPHFLTYNESGGQMIPVWGFLGGRGASLSCSHSDIMNYWEGVREKKSNLNVICGLVIGAHLL